jgi:dGTPase
MDLATYAVTEKDSPGRAFHEAGPKDGRSEFARDRDRVTHSYAFRQLSGKTQVFTLASNQFGSSPSDIILYDDAMRTRMSHSIEVAQVARSIARALNLNEDLSETLALAHDMGHTPFGHSGQDVLNGCMKPYGGFEHNIQSLRVVTDLEHRYTQFKGLNLMFETKEGILKHCSAKNAALLGDIAARHREKKSPTLEAQATDLGDAIAYMCHDIDDGIRSGLVTPKDFADVELFGRCWKDVQSRFSGQPEALQVQETIRDMMGLMIRGTIVNSLQNLERYKIKTVSDVRNAPEIILLPDGLAKQHAELKSQMYKKLYHHQEVNLVRKDVEQVIGGLFHLYMDSPDLMPAGPAGEARVQPNDTDTQKARAVCDYVAGLTDAQAYQQIKRFEPILTANRTLELFEG